MLLSALPLAFIAARVTQPMARRIPGRSPTLGDLVLHATTTSVKDGDSNALSRGEILYKIRLIVSEQMGIPMERIKAESRFVEDLHVDG